jgi:hypothetical protein
MEIIRNIRNKVLGGVDRFPIALVKQAAELLVWSN